MKKLQVIVIEPSANARSILVKILENSGHKVTCLTEPEYSRESTFRRKLNADLITCSYLLGNLYGSTVLRILREVGNPNRQIPVLFALTSVESLITDINRDFGKMPKGVQIVTKPFNQSSINTALMAIFSKE